MSVYITEAYAKFLKVASETKSLSNTVSFSKYINPGIEFHKK